MKVFNRLSRNSTECYLRSASTIGGVFLSYSFRSLQVTSNDDTSNKNTATTTNEIGTTTTCWNHIDQHKHGKKITKQRKHPIILAKEPEHPEDVFTLDQVEPRDRIVERIRKLPQTALKDSSKSVETNKYYISSNHVMVNDERAKHTIAPLSRSRKLDEIARMHVEAVAAVCELSHLDPSVLQEKLGDCCSLMIATGGRLGENVARGSSTNNIHGLMMDTLSDRSNLLDPRYTSMGMASTMGKDGKLYLCQIFRG